MMWLASLRRLVADKSRSRPNKDARPQRRRIIPRLDHLEDRIVPSTINVNAGDTTGLIAAINQANSDYANSGALDTIILNTNSQLQSVYNFTAVNNNTNGPNVLPVITAKGLMIVGNGSTLNAAGYGRLFDVSASAGLSLVNLQSPTQGSPAFLLTGGKVSGSTAYGGAVYNSGSLSMKSVIVGGNQATGGNGQNAAGGGIYSNSGSLTLSHDVIGRSVQKSHSQVINLKTYTEKTKASANTIGASNQATSGTGGSAMGAGLYVSGGSINVSSCTIAGNHLSGSVNAQGGGLYVSGVSQPKLINDVIGREFSQKTTIYPIGVTSTSQATAYSRATNTIGSANNVTGGSAMGGGLYVAGGTVSVSGGAIAGNKATGGAGQNAAGGGVYSLGASLVLNKVALIQNSASGGNGGVDVSGGNAQGGELFISGGQASFTDSQVTNSGEAAALGGNGGGGGGSGGNAQGGGIFAINTSLTLTGGSIVDRNAIQAGKGGNGTSHHLAGGQGGNAQGGGIYASATKIVIESGSSIFNNYARAGAGGKGEDALASPVNATVNRPGGSAGGQGGNGGLGQGGGLFANGGSVSITGTSGAGNTSISFNDAVAGNGGRGGRGGAGVAHGQTGGVGGQGGAGGEGDGGGIYINAAPLTVSGGVTFDTNVADGGVGGGGGPGGMGWSANIGTRGTLKSSFGGNGGAGGAGGAGGTGQGGALFAVGSGLTISLGDASGSVVMQNNQVNGGHGGNGQAGDVGVGSSAFYAHVTYIDGHGGNGGNGAAGIGGGAAIYGDKLLLTNDAVDGNYVTGGGGGTNKGRYPFYDSSASASIGVSGGGGSAIGGAGGSGQGGGLFVSGSSSATILNSSLSGNTANYDGFYYGDGNSGGNGGNGGKNFATYDDSKMHGGNGGAGGGNQGAGLYATSSILSILNSTIADNTLYDSLGGAGGTGAQGNGIAGANGTSQGSGVFATGGSLSLINDTLAWNFLYSAGTVSPNDLGAGIYNDASNSLTLQNTIVAHDQIYNATTTTSMPSDLYGAASSSSDHNLIGDGSGSSGLSNGTNGNQVGTDLAPIDPLFSAPAPTGPGYGQLPGNYGGLTPTLPLYAKSPAIAAGNPAAASAIASAEGVLSGNATDQRGLPRLVAGAIDIGATEMQVDFTGSASVTTVQVGGTILYTLTVTNGEGVPINATLTDVVPVNTTYNTGSASGTGWTITEPAASNSNTLTATMSLNPGATATLTFSVTVASSASNTTIMDIGNLDWTGTNTSGTLSVPMNTTVTGGMSTTSTVLTTSGTPSVYGQSVTFTATVSSASGTPTGEVAFEDGNTILGKSTLSGGAATFTTSALSVANHSITAIYCGDSSDYGSTSNTLTQVVNQDHTTTTLVSSITPSVYGQSVTFTAAVSADSPGAGTPSGTVTFYDGDTKLGTGTLSGGIATFSTSALSVANHSITAVYSGDTDDQGSTSNVTSQAVDQDSTSVNLASSALSSVYGQSVTLTAAVSVVSPGAGTPTGTVTFMDGSTILGTGTLSGGVATLTTSALSTGSHNITAVYSGDTDDLGSTSGSALSQVVNQDRTTTALASSASPSILGQGITLTATVSVVSPGAGTPSGTVTFYNGTTLLGTGTLSGGAATLNVSSLPAGNDNLSAVYSGDGNDLTSTGTLAQQVHYQFGGFLPPLSNGMAYEINRTIPIKFTLSDYNGNAITSLSAVTSIQVFYNGAPITMVSTNNAGLQCAGGHYQYNWQTNGLSAGSYEIVVTLADGTTQTKIITLTAHGSAAGLTAGSSGSTASAGALLGGEVDLYVDNSDGDLTSDELARIQDAVSIADATIAPYGVTINIVTSPTLANTTLSMNTTSSLGGAAQGVLGCTTDADQVTMIQGWNWYAGADPTQIASGQYDFETAVIHELGHVLGLGHSSDSTSVMYGTLATGTANRVLAPADLNVADDDSGPCALHVAPAMADNAPSLPTPAGMSRPTDALSVVDQFFTNLTLLLNTLDARLFSMSPLGQQVDAWAMQSLDVLLSLESSVFQAVSARSELEA